MNINFDMDGTLANLYGVDNWLQFLMNEDSTPYEIAEPLINLQALAHRLNNLQKIGYTINIISWLSKNSSKNYDSMVITAKLKWLHTHLKSVRFDNIYIVPYGTPKHQITSGILFDDEEPNRTAWGEGAYSEKEIFEILQGLN